MGKNYLGDPKLGEIMSFDNSQGNEFFKRAVTRRWRWIAWFSIVGVLLAGVTFMLSPREYTSTANVFLNPLVGSPFSPTTPTSRTEQLAAMNTEAGVVLTDEVLDQALQKAEIAGASRQSLREQTVASVPSNSQVMNIRFTSADPQEAQRGAQAVTDAFMNFRSERAQSVIDAQSKLLQSREESLAGLLKSANQAYDAAKKAGSDSAGVIELEQQVRLYAQELANVKVDRTTTETSSIDPGTVVGPANLPQAPEGINPLLLAAAVLLGFVALGFVATLIVEHGDKRVWDEGDLERRQAPSVLAVLGDAREKKDNAAEGVIEKYLRVTPVISGHVNTPGTLALIGNQSSQEVHTIAAGLAAAFAMTGRRVCVISTTRLPGDSETQLGFSDVLEDGVALREAIHVKKFGEGRLAVMSAGTQSEKLPGLVQADSLKNLINLLGAGHDLLIFVVHQGASAVASAISGVCDHSVLTVSGGKDTVTSVFSTANYLQMRGATISGTLLYSSAWVQASEKELAQELQGAFEQLHHGLDPRRVSS